MPDLYKVVSQTVSRDAHKVLQRRGPFQSRDGQTKEASAYEGYLYLCNPYKDVHVSAFCCFMHSAEDGVVGNVLLDSNAGISYGCVIFKNGQAELYNNGVQKAVFFMDSSVYRAGELMLPERRRVLASDLPRMDAPDDLVILAGFASGIQSLMAAGKL